VFEKDLLNNLLYLSTAEKAKPCSILAQMISEAKEIRENQSYRQAAINQANMQLQSKNEV
jgi:serine/threonine kinase 3